MCTLSIITSKIKEMLFRDYFQQIGFPVQTDKEIMFLLRESVANSLAKHYHGGKETDVLSPEGTYYVYMHVLYCFML